MKKRKQPVGFVYFMYSAGFIKIGFSETPKVRHAAIDKGSAFRVHLLHLLPGSRELERSFHTQFAADRHNGEWFRFSPAIRTLLLDHLRATVGGESLLARAEAEHASWVTQQIEQLRRTA